MKSLRLLLSLLLLIAVAGCAVTSDPSLDYSKAAYERGKKDARAESAKGILAVETFGLPPRWIGIYRRILKAKYGIEDRSVAGCMVDDEIIGHAKGFNEVMETEIEKRRGKDVFEKAVKEAKAEYEKSENERLEESLKGIG